jgi:hypothetical protein
VAFCLALINFLNNCGTFKPPLQQVKTEAVIEQLAPLMPEFPTMEPVYFVSIEKYLCLSSDDYRALERNVIGLREYIEKLEAVLKFYQGEGKKE